MATDSKDRMNAEGTANEPDAGNAAGDQVRAAAKKLNRLVLHFAATIRAYEDFKTHPGSGAISERFPELSGIGHAADVMTADLDSMANACAAYLLTEVTSE